MAIDVEEIARSASFRGALDEKTRAVLRDAEKYAPPPDTDKYAPPHDSRTELVHLHTEKATVHGGDMGSVSAGSA